MYYICCETTRPHKLYAVQYIYQSLSIIHDDEGYADDDFDADKKIDINCLPFADYTYD